MLDKAEYSAFKSTLNSSIVSYRMLQAHVVMMDDVSDSCAVKFDDAILVNNIRNSSRIAEIQQDMVHVTDV